MIRDISFPPANGRTPRLRRVLIQSEAGFAEYSPQALDILRAGLSDAATRRLTGCLHLQGGLAFQVLEGPARAIEARLRELAADRRYLRLQIRLDERCDTRRFRDWEMSYTSNHGLDLRDCLQGWQGALAEAPVPAVLGFLEDVSALKSEARRAAAVRAQGLRTDASAQPQWQPAEFGCTA